MNKNQWNDTHISKLNFELSLSCPLFVNYKHFFEPTHVHFDMHYPLELGIVLEGKVKRYYVEDWSSIYGPGQIWFNGIWDPHGWEVLKAPFTCVYMIILPEMIAHLQFEEKPDLEFMTPFIVPPSQRPYVPAGNQREFVSLGKKMLRILNSHKQNKSMWYKLFLMEAFLAIYDFWSPPNNIPKEDLYSFLKINKVFYTIFTNHHFISEQQAAKICNMNLKSFNKMFTKLMGSSFSKFAVRYRVNGAASQLLKTDQSIKAIAYQWGFRQTSHFDRCFKRHYGCTPDQYRECYLGSVGDS